MNRICPSEEILSEYLSGTLRQEDVLLLEEHLIKCESCRELLADAYHITSKRDITELLHKTRNWIKKNKWLIGAFVSFILSFILPRYFLQFIAAFVVLGAKWVLDAKTTKTLIMISEAWKRGDKDEAGKILSRFDLKK